MSALKLGMMGVALAGSLVGGAGKANADVRIGFGPARVNVVAPRFVSAPQSRWGRQVVVSPAPRYYGHRNYDHNYNYGGTVTVYGNQYGGASWQSPEVFAAQIRAEMNQADADVRYHVQTGTVSPQALASLDADRQEIERDLGDACAKGYVTSDDRSHLEQHVAEIRDLRDRYRVSGYEPSAYGYR